MTKKEHKMSKSSRATKSAPVEPVEHIEEVVESKVERVRPAVDEKGRYKTVDMTMEEIQSHQFKTKSAQIRYLHSQNYSPMAIAKFMNIIYQHVRNVLTQPTKRPVAPTQAPTQNEEEGDKAE